MTAKLTAVPSVPTEEPLAATDPFEVMFDQWMRLISAPFAAVVPFEVNTGLELLDRLRHVDELM